MSLTDVMKEHGAELVGRKVFEKNGTEFPLLIKFIDAKDNLSVQVHPDDNLAARIRPGQKGKTEMWYVVGADKAPACSADLRRRSLPRNMRKR